jgi:hypothetical protein
MEIFFCFQNGLSLVIFTTKYGVISAQRKKKKFSRSQENEVIRVIFCENASFYSMNSNPAEN